MTDYERARDYAVRYLSASPRSRKQLRDKLTEKDFSTQAITAVIHLLEEKGYINDIAFAQSYISHKSRLNNFGKRRIVMDLLKKGVGKDDIMAAYHQAEEDDTAGSEADAATRALAKRLARKDFAAIKKDPKEMQKLMGYLVRRGFSYDVVKEALKNYEE
ncbi:MAG: recombination regulator RecX [Defluviitaleaceae bacterium]|nr:recombination regulator RecX [Defluviitaleaceae bacterium]